MRPIRPIFRHLGLVVAGLAAGTSAAPADPVADFYASNGLKVYTSGAPGGGIDSVARVFARHVVNYIPGKPTAIVMNMPSGSGIGMTNWAYNVAPRDGSIVAYPHLTVATNQIVHPNTVKYDVTKLSWVGNLEQQQMTIVTWHTSPTKTIEDAMRRETPMAASSKGSPVYQILKLSNLVLGTKFKIALGYETTRMLAVERGEVEGTASALETLPGLAPSWMEPDAKLINFLVFNAQKRLAKYPSVPTMLEFTRDAEHRKLLEFMMLQTLTGRVFFAPPGIPADRLEALRRAFDRTAADPAFLAEMKRLKIEVDASTGEEVQEAVAQGMAGISPELAAKIVKAIE